MNYTALSKDTRPIHQVVLTSGQNHSYLAVGENGVTRISAIDEYGEMSYVPWFEVWKGDKLYCRVNAAHVSEVYYQEGQPDSDTPF